MDIGNFSFRAQSWESQLVYIGRSEIEIETNHSFEMYIVLIICQSHQSRCGLCNDGGAKREFALHITKVQTKNK